MTKHTIISADSSNLSEIETGSVDLIVTSPPYPMIEMWDETFSHQDPKIGIALNNGDGNAAFSGMHDVLDRVWRECDRVLADSGFVCINIGDAVRTVGGIFRMYSNHSRIIDSFIGMGYSVLPDIIWRKQSNAPNKFMGSGMYPAGAYVTYEHEYILIFRKGGKRVFKGEEKTRRQKSAYFWEERNIWFSDLWEIKGTSQQMKQTASLRNRNASFPIEIPLRLVNMYSVEDDTVLDPFAGLGTTGIACMISKRNSIGVDIDKEIAEIALGKMEQETRVLNQFIDNRLRKHIDFIEALPEDVKARCYVNETHRFPVRTKQETGIGIDRLASISRSGNTVLCEYEKHPGSI